MLSLPRSWQTEYVSRDNQEINQTVNPRHMLLHLGLTHCFLCPKISLDWFLSTGQQNPGSDAGKHRNSTVAGLKWILILIHILRYMLLYYPKRHLAHFRPVIHLHFQYSGYWDCLYRKNLIYQMFQSGKSKMIC